eukprot:3939228-Rhodomonas_salina.3
MESGTQKLLKRNTFHTPTGNSTSMIKNQLKRSNATAHIIRDSKADESLTVRIQMQIKKLYKQRKVKKTELLSLNKYIQDCQAQPVQEMERAIQLEKDIRRMNKKCKKLRSILYKF